MRITTLNVNSIRLRGEGLRQVGRVLAPDVLCLQETKVRNELFPLEELLEASVLREGAGLERALRTTFR